MRGLTIIRYPRRLAKSVLLCLTVIAVVFIVSLPILWTLFSSFKSKPDLFSMPIKIWPTQGFTLANYITTWETTDVPLYLLNSLIVALGATILTVVVSTLASYSLSRFPFSGKVLIARGVLFGYMLPGILLVVPYFLMFNRLQLINTRGGLMLAHAAMSLPFSMWLLWTFFQTIPQDIEDASKVDGAGRLRVLTNIFLPLATPGIVASGIITFIFSWNDYLFASVIASANRVQTLPLGIALMASRDYLRWEVMLASSGIIIFTVFILLAVFQKYLLEGFSAAFTK